MGGTDLWIWAVFEAGKQTGSGAREQSRPLGTQRCELRQAEPPCHQVLGVRGLRGSQAPPASQAVPTAPPGRWSQLLCSGAVAAARSNVTAGPRAGVTGAGLRPELPLGWEELEGPEGGDVLAQLGPAVRVQTPNVPCTLTPDRRTLAGQGPELQPPCRVPPPMGNQARPGRPWVSSGGAVEPPGQAGEPGARVRGARARPRR